MGANTQQVPRAKRASRNLRVVGLEEDPRERVPFYPTPEDSRNLETAKRLASSNNNQAIRAALKWYVWLLEQKNAGATVQVVRGDRVFELLTL